MPLVKWCGVFVRRATGPWQTASVLADTCVEYDDDRHVTGLSHG